MIEFRHVTKAYDYGVQALHDISLFIDKGEFVFLTGESGAGKTTLLRHVFMDEFPTGGQVAVCGETVGGRSEVRPSRRAVQRLRQKIGIVFQDIRLLSDRTVFENIAFAARIPRFNEAAIRKASYDALAKVGLSHKCLNFPEQLSGGEQQRVAIARAIVNEPLILIADEPTGNLDRRISDEIFTLLQEINNWGTTVIMSTHEQLFIERTHYRNILLHNGSLLKGGGSRLLKATAQ